MKSFLGRLLLLYLIVRLSSFCTHGAAFYLVFAGFCWLPSKRSRSSSSIRCKYSGSKRCTPQIVEYCDWLNNLAFSFWVCTCIFRSPLKCGILKVWTSEQSNGRQEPLNCHCEGLIVFLASHTYLFYFEQSTRALIYKLYLSLQHIQKNLFSRTHNEVLDLNNLLASVHQVFISSPPRLLHHRSYKWQLEETAED